MINLKNQATIQIARSFDDNKISLHNSNTLDLNDIAQLPGHCIRNALVSCRSNFPPVFTWGEIKKPLPIFFRQ